MSETENDVAKNTGKPANSAPDAVMDPNEKTDGKPGEGPTPGKGSKGGTMPDDETDPGGG